MVHQYSNSYYKSIQGVPYFHLREKNHYETGVAMGKLLVAAKHPTARFLKHPLTKLALGFLGLISRRMYTNVNIPKEYLEELKGYSEGSGIKFKHLFVANFIYDAFKKLGIQHCSTFAHFDKKQVWVGRNTDLHPKIIKLGLKHAPSIIVNVSIPGTYQFMHVSVPFLVGSINGFNEQGIAVTSHQMLSCKEENKHKRLATTALVRKLLEETKTLQEARTFTKKNLTGRSLNVTVISHEDKDASNFEVNPGLFNEVQKETQYIAAATHFTSEKMNVLHNKSVEGSEKRLRSMTDTLANVKKFSEKDVVNLLRDTRHGPQHKETAWSMTNPGTYQSFYIDLTKKILYASNAKKAPVSMGCTYVKIPLS